tara:strand:- start:30333 stop:31403 length:1071 start_codon:yes stop_codon:yes gene_type:complete
MSLGGKSKIERLNDFQVLVFQADFNGTRLPNFLIEDWAHTRSTSLRFQMPSEVEKSIALEARDQSYEATYASYRSQGPERKSFVERFIQEDQVKASNIRQVIIYSKGEAVARMQILISDTAHLKTNLEEHFPNETRNIRGVDGSEKVVEINRWSVLDASQVKSPVNRKILSDPQKRDYLNSLLLLNTMQEIKNLKEPHLALFQINLPVYKLLRRMLGREEMSEYIKVQMEPGLPFEYVVLLNAEKVDSIYRTGLRNVVSANLKQFLGTSDRELTFSINPKEVGFFEEMGVYTLSQDYVNSKANQQVKAALGVDISQILKNSTSFAAAANEQKEHTHTVTIGRGEAAIILNRLGLTE